MATIGQTAIEFKNQETAQFFETLNQKEQLEQQQRIKEQQKLKRMLHLVKSGLVWQPTGES